MKKALSIKTLRNRADRLTQEYGRKKYNACLVCGNPQQLLHHYYPKSVSSALRYDKLNLIPLCQKCHFRHHQANDPRIHDIIRTKMGEQWLEDLNKKKHLIIKTNVQYYKDIIKKYE